MSKKGIGNFEPITIALIVFGADVIIIQSYCIRS
jgi:hypothetical protein